MESAPFEHRRRVRGGTGARSLANFNIQVMFRSTTSILALLISWCSSFLRTVNSNHLVKSNPFFLEMFVTGVVKGIKRPMNRIIWTKPIDLNKYMVPVHDDSYGTFTPLFHQLEIIDYQMAVLLGEKMCLELIAKVDPFLQKVRFLTAKKESVFSFDIIEVRPERSPAYKLSVASIIKQFTEARNLICHFDFKLKVKKNKLNL